MVKSARRLVQTILAVTRDLASLASLAMRSRAQLAAECWSCESSGLLVPGTANRAAGIFARVQDLEGLHRAIPRHTGEWHFTGRYPTPGGYRVLNTYSTGASTRM
jgi:hypothetical protein